MKIEELIEKLKDMPQDADVAVSFQDDEGYSILKVVDGVYARDKTDRLMEEIGLDHTKCVFIEWS